jgi:hypothetical protein
MAAGAAAWVITVGLWLTGWDVGRLVPWLAGFLVLTIAGERLELSRVTRLSRMARASFACAAGIFAVGVLTAIGAFTLGVRIAGAGLLGFAGWLAVYDVARRTVRQRGLTRYMASCLLTGYAWLAMAGVLWLRTGLASEGPGFDAALHAVFLGFVIGMVMAHAPVIVPAVFRAAVPYRPHFYAHLTLLHASLLLRLVGGDLAGNHAAWQIGGALNEIALLCFLVVTADAVRSGRRASASTPPSPFRERQLAAATPARGTQP